MTDHKPRSKAPMTIATILALFLIGGAITLLFIGSKNDSDYATIDFSGPPGMGSGGVIFGTDMNPLATDAIAAGKAPLPHLVDRDLGEVDIIVYVDYRCPHCMMFESVNSNVLEKAAAAGATVEIKPLNFMDRLSAGEIYSSRAANLLACTVEFEANSAWSMHGLLLDPSVQPEGEGPGHDDATLLEMALQVTGSTNPEYADCIKDRTYVPFVNAMNDWTFNHPVPGSLNNSLMVEGTPFVVVNGIEFTGDITDSDSLHSFLLEQGLSL